MKTQQLQKWLRENSSWVYMPSAEASNLIDWVERENARLVKDLSLLVCAILKRNGRDVADMTAMERTDEMHANERLLLLSDEVREQPIIGGVPQ